MLLYLTHLFTPVFCCRFLKARSKYYDPGHVAIISVNPGQVPGTIDDKTIISIGTNSEKGMHEERTTEYWAGRHGLAI
jgi:hypothetical protein